MARLRRQVELRVDAEPVEQALVAAPAAAHLDGQVEVGAACRARARSPCARRCRSSRTMLPAACRSGSPFWDSVSTHSTARTTVSPSSRRSTLLDLHLDRVRHLLARALQRLLADQLREHASSSGWSRALVRREVERPLRQQAGERVAQRRRPAIPSAPTPGTISRTSTPSSSRPAAPHERRGRLGRASSRSTLFTATTTGSFAAASACAMKRSPPPMRSAPFSTNRAASHSAQLALDPALHALGEHVARALHAGQVDQHELPGARPRARRSRSRGSRGGWSAACPR